MTPKIYLRFGDLKERGLVRSWPQLRRMIRHYGFPPGRMLSPNVRIWTGQELETYFASRPIEGPPARGCAKRGRPRKVASTTEAIAAE
jgi:hypothetical protein